MDWEREREGGRHLPQKRVKDDNDDDEKSKTNEKNSAHRLRLNDTNHKHLQLNWLKVKSYCASRAHKYSHAHLGSECEHCEVSMTMRELSVSHSRDPIPIWIQYRAMGEVYSYCAFDSDCDVTMKTTHTC